MAPAQCSERQPPIQHVKDYKHKELGEGGDQVKLVCSSDKRHVGLWTNREHGFE